MMHLSPALVIFDCDGVLLDANPMKVQAFRDVLTVYPEPATALFSEFQARNFGRSRYALFRLFFDFLGRPPHDGEVDGLIDAYARIVRQSYLHVPLTPGCLETLRQLQGRVPLYVASGSDQEELRWVFGQRGLSGLFAGIYGSPQKKTDIVASLAPAKGQRALLIGDAVADWQAAQAATACDFIYMRDFSTAQADMDALAHTHALPIIGQLPELLDLLAV